MYVRGEISLEDFQLRLEPLLGDYEVVSKDDEEFIKKTTNEIELIIYTVPEPLQKEKVLDLIPEILSYARAKDAMQNE